MPERLERGEDTGGLFGTFLRLAAEAGGKAFRILADGDGKTNANEFWTNLTYCHDFKIGSRGEWTLTPNAGLSYNYLKTDGFNAIFSDTLSAGIGYNGEANNSFQVHQAYASLRMRF